MKKLILIFLAAVMLLLPLAGCKKEQVESGGENTQSGTEGEEYYLNTLSPDLYDFESIKIYTQK